MIVVRHITNSIFASNTYIVSVGDSKRYWLVDIGDLGTALEKTPVDSLIVGVFLTHTHYDHIYGVKQLLEVYPSCLIYTSSFGKEALSSSKFNFSRYYGEKFEFQSDNIVVLKEGDIVRLGDGVQLIVYETSGHDRSCLTYKIENNFFTGDSFIPGIKVMDRFPNSNKEDALFSQKRILLMLNGCNLYPGHGEIYENFQSQAYL